MAVTGAYTDPTWGAARRRLRPAGRDVAGGEVAGRQRLVVQIRVHRHEAEVAGLQLELLLFTKRFIQKALLG